MVCDSNKDPVATFSYCKTDMAFESMTIRFAGAIKGWKEGCRSVIGLDACHLNGKCSGVLMAATGLDGQNGLVPLGIGVFPTETIENWTMFLTDLKPLLSSHQNPLTFISDRHKGLHEVVPVVYPDSHALKHMEDMKKENVAAVVYLEEVGVESWSRAFFDDTSKCEHLNNNSSDSFISMVKNLRYKPICRLGILYNRLVMSLFHKRRKESAKWDPTRLVPTAMKLIGKMCKLVGAFKVDPCVSGKLYEVTNEGSKAVFIVKLDEKQCSCLQWQLIRFVCQHVVCCLKPFRPDWTRYCSHYYTIAAYKRTYALVVFPFPAPEDWSELEEHENIELESAIKIRKSGRPRVKRRRSWDEPKAPTKAYSCSRCKSTGHNKTTCQGGDVGKNPKSKRQRTQVDGATFTSFDRPAASTSKAKKKQSSQPSSVGKAAVASSSKAKYSQPI
ncbi:uncharacterized protein LOC113360587 [Papaver somniferum]|uniref:uncharacterized protein LOC113360587 n=1 Tax=Papaver somniferum TaxID=3469 RepID=UPI000E7002DA|nr:uncharacterized protein LOC113360587 [Papaver somniferum]